MSRRFRDVEHVLRLIGIFALGVAAFLVMRWWLVPPDFGVYGHYRAGALADNRFHPIAYAGQASCADCHSETLEARKGSRHERIACEACHGPLARHASGEVDEPPARPDPRATCVRCHDARAGKPAAFPQVDVGDHAAEGPCTECHRPHSPAVS